MASYQLDGCRWDVERAGERGASPLLLLHGFAGGAAEMLEAAGALTGCELFAVDLPGHGGSTPPSGWGEAVAGLARLLGALDLERADVWGYSLGGRLALALALEHPERVGALVLESASPGLEREAERAARRAADEGLATRIEREGIPAFVDYWEGLPLFAGERALPEAVRERQRQLRLGQRPLSLARALRGLGVGAQPSYWGALRELRGPALLLTGERDAKFDEVAARMAALLPRARRARVPGAGHAVHRERPEQTLAAVAEFLREG